MKRVTTASVVGSSQTYEDQHVHAVYDRIATHFSSTRYKPWPIIAKFISSLPSGWIGLDSGTGNGKYLPLPADRPGSILTIGLDRSRNLLLIARNAGSAPVVPIVREVVLGDVLDNGWRAGVFDYAISIATIHHLSSHERRKLAVQVHRPIFVSHALIVGFDSDFFKQDELSKRVIPTDDDTRNVPSPSGKDVFVPWVMSAQGTAFNQAAGQPAKDVLSNPVKDVEAPIYNRYYHMFARGELVKLTREAAQEVGLVVGPPEEHGRGIEIVQNGWERSNYYIELRCWKA